MDCGGHKQDPLKNPHPPKPPKPPKPHDDSDNILNHQKDDDATLPIIPTGTQPTPNWTNNASSVAWVAVGVGLLVIGAIALSGGIVLGAVAIGALAEGAVGAEAAMALYALAVDTVFVGGSGIAGIGMGIKAIQIGTTP